jgi:putative ABC transport system permease protein
VELGATCSLFGPIALVVAAIGLYAVVAYDVSQRARTRRALGAGAKPAHLLRLIVGDGVWHAVLGVVVGVGMSWLVAPFARDMLFNVEPRDPATYGIVTVLLLLAALVACALPARRATKVAPAEVLRSD